MTQIEYLEARIGILEGALGALIQGELITLAPYQSDRYRLLENINNRCISELDSIDSLHEADNHKG